MLGALHFNIHTNRHRAGSAETLQAPVHARMSPLNVDDSRLDSIWLIA